jgi:arylformamidase
MTTTVSTPDQHAHKKQIFDISPPISAATAVWPGDVAFRRDVQLDMNAGANLTLSSLTSTVHIGAHADAPSHYQAAAPTIDQVSLDAYIGPCTVVSVNIAPGGLIEPKHCAQALQSGAKRILFRTLSQPNYQHFNTDFVAFSAAAITLMGQAGVVLIGIDTASVDPFESKNLPAHQELHRHGIRNLEGLDLSAVADGDYELIALPLRLVGFDASPVRAILRR